MNKETINWLMEGPAWIKYAVEKQLLDSQPDVQPVLRDSNIVEILKRLKDKQKGIPAIPSGGFMNSDEFENPYWDLFFLADLGLTAVDLGLTREIEGFLDTQSYNGTYMTEESMQPSYYCKSAILLSAIARMGYQNDPHMEKYIQLFLKSQRRDGGWYCNPNHDIGNALEYEPSCPQDNMNILLILGQYAQFRNESRFNGAIDLLLNHWNMRNTGLQIVYFGVGRRYQGLCYPAPRYGILRVLDALSLFPYAMKKANFHNMLDFVHKKGVDGKYIAEMPSSYTGLEPAGQPSRLITFIINRLDKRLADFQGVDS